MLVQTVHQWTLVVPLEEDRMDVVLIRMQFVALIISIVVRMGTLVISPLANVLEMAPLRSD